MAADELDEWGMPPLQSLIDSGTAWMLEGAVGRAAMAAIEAGECVLPTEAHRDYWGNRIPARGELQAGSLGTLGYANRLRAERGEPLLIEGPDGAVTEGVQP